MRSRGEALVERSAAVVQRYGGTVEYTGDGVMALFGAPVALEDHAFRGCLGALAIQEEANRLAAEVARRDGVALRLRVVSIFSGRRTPPPTRVQRISCLRDVRAVMRQAFSAHWVSARSV
jgi:class 3 adenylate cyclase